MSDKETVESEQNEIRRSSPDRLLTLVPKRDWRESTNILWSMSRVVLDFYKNYTVCTVVLPFDPVYRGKIVHGIAKRNPTDKFYPAVGAAIAVNRAYKQL
jgi:hypothetical protein